VQPEAALVRRLLQRLESAAVARSHIGRRSEEGVDGVRAECISAQIQFATSGSCVNVVRIEDGVLSGDKRWWLGTGRSDGLLGPGPSLKSEAGALPAGGEREREVSSSSRIYRSAQSWQGCAERGECTRQGFSEASMGGKRELM